MVMEGFKIKVLPSVCRLCKADCGILVHVNENHVVEKVEGDQKSPLNRGALCSKGNALPQLLYDPARLLNPLRRRGRDSWEPVSWEDALDEIGEKLERIRRKYGAASLATYEGRISKLKIKACILRQFI